MNLIKQLDVVSLLLWVILSFNVIENINSSRIFSCLHSIEGPVTYPDDPLFQSLIIDQTIRVNYTPSVLVYAINNEDVIKAVNCARNLTMDITVRSGGHSFEKYGLGGEDNYIVVDVTYINGITIDSDNNTAKIGAGNRLGDVYNKLNQEGFFIPAGSCPSVGIAGHALSGGYGFYSREYGLATDNILSMEMVDANGTLLQIDNSTTSPYGDLFFALRGAGDGSYGIVTHFVFRIYKTPPIITYMKLDFDSANMTQLYLLFEFYNNVGPSLNRNITLHMRLEKNKSIKSLSVYGLYLGEREKAEAEINKLLANNTGEQPKEPIIKPIKSEYDNLTFFESVYRLSSLADPPFQSKHEVADPQHHPNFFKAKSFLVDIGKGLNSNAINELVRFLDETLCDTYATFALFGGAINDPSINSSFIHRNVLYDILLEIDWTYETSNSSSTECIQNINSFGKNFQKKFTSPHSYQGFIDRDLDNWEYRYYGENLSQLEFIKYKYDPGNLFKFNQSIPPYAP